MADEKTGGFSSNPSSPPKIPPTGAFRAPVPPPMAGSKKKTEVSSAAAKPVAKQPPLNPPTPSYSPLSGGNPKGEESVSPKSLITDHQSQSGDVTIRTMQDDLLGRAPAPQPKGPLAPAPLKPQMAAGAKPSAGREPKQTSPITNHQSLTTNPKSQANFPLPPRGGQPERVIAAPQRGKRLHFRRPRLGRTLAITGVLLFLIAGGAIAGWYFIFQDGSSPTVSERELVSDAASVLPEETALIVQYRFETPADRTAAKNLWQVPGETTTAGVIDFLEGNPSLFIEDVDITELFYVILPDEPRPFAVVPKTPSTTTQLAQEGSAEVLERDGWYIFHPLSTAAYEAALQQGTLAAQPDTANLLNAAQPNSFIRFLVGGSALKQIRAALVNQDFADGPLLSATLFGQLSPTQSSLTITGTAKSLAAALPGTFADPALLAAIPADATFARLGGNLAQDLAAWLAVAKTVDEATLAQPLVASLLSELNVPYAFYSRQGEDGVEDFGLAVALPQGAAPVTVGDPALEAALPALAPLFADGRSLPPLAFAAAAYQGVPLRYVNIAGDTQALDYAIHDSTLLVATSKEGIFAALDTALGTRGEITAGEKWGATLREWGALPQAHSLWLGELDYPALTQLLPAREVPKLGVAATLADSQGELTGLIMLGESAVAPLPNSPDLASPSPAAEAVTASPLVCAPGETVVCPVCTGGTPPELCQCQCSEIPVTEEF